MFGGLAEHGRREAPSRRHPGCGTALFGLGDFESALSASLPLLLPARRLQERHRPRGACGQALAALDMREICIDVHRYASVESTGGATRSIP